MTVSKLWANTPYIFYLFISFLFIYLFIYFLSIYVLAPEIFSHVIFNITNADLMYAFEIENLSTIASISLSHEFNDSGF